jgi:hypothetical protein
LGKGRVTVGEVRYILPAPWPMKLILRLSVVGCRLSEGRAAEDQEINQSLNETFRGSMGVDAERGWGSP